MPDLVLYLLVGLLAIVGYIFIGRMTYTLWGRLLATAEKEEAVSAGILWPLAWVLLVVALLILVVGKICDVIAWIFKKIIFPAADRLGEKTADVLERM